MRKLALAAAAAAISLSAPAAATAVNYNFGGAGSGFMALNLTGGTYALDTLSLTLGTATFNAAGSTLTPGSPYFLGGNLNGDTVVVSNTNDYFFLFDPASSSQTASLLQYANVGTPGVLGGNLTITQVAAAVPEPASWALMLLGFGAIGVAMRRRKAALPLAA